MIQDQSLSVLLFQIDLVAGSAFALIGSFLPKLDMVEHAHYGDLGGWFDSSEAAQVGFDEHPTGLVEGLEVGATENGPGETTSTPVLLAFEDFVGHLLEDVDRVDDELGVLTLGDDTTLFETATKGGGHHYPSFVIETMEVLAKEHFIFFRSVFTVLPPTLG
jgi:hypothetical protein